MALNDRLREARLRAGLSQRELAKRIDAKPQSISAWEKGDYSPSESALFKLMKELNVDANYLYEDDMKSVREITPEERGLIYKIRQLKPWQKEMIVGNIDTLLDHSETVPVYSETD